MNAQRGTTTFAMGDNTTITCRRMTPYTKGTKPGAASPTCGHTCGSPRIVEGSVMRLPRRGPLCWSRS